MRHWNNPRNGRSLCLFEDWLGEVMMLNARSGLRLIPRILRLCGYAALAICVLGASAARAEEPSAAGLWQKIEDGEPALGRKSVV